MGAQRSPSDDKEVTEEGALIDSASSLSELVAKTEGKRAPKKAAGAMKRLLL